MLTASCDYRGALTLASPEVKFEIDTETHDPLDVGMYQVREANQMVEEMMLLANITVAEHILRHFPAQALLRRHPVPPPRQFDPLLKAAVAAGVSINPETSQVGSNKSKATCTACNRGIFQVFQTSSQLKRQMENMPSLGSIYVAAFNIDLLDQPVSILMFQYCRGQHKPQPVMMMSVMSLCQRSRS